MVADEAAKKGSATSDASKPVEKSPHAKEVSFLVTCLLERPSRSRYRRSSNLIFLHSSTILYGLGAYRP